MRSLNHNRMFTGMVIHVIHERSAGCGLESVYQ
jgi:hypothetical protein